MRDKGGNNMPAIVMDLLMAATLVISFILIKLLADWCEKQVDK